jgi:uncharacterized damage-inducible protein DinB
MAMIHGLLQELEQEAQTTRRVLERVPDAHLGWKPHVKSMSLGQLALHIAAGPGMVAELALQSSVPLPEFTQPSATSAAELLATLDESVARAKALLEGMDDATFGQTWRVMHNEQEVMAMPRGALLRMILLNHWYHHRGQLSVYLRQLNVPVPSIYGPSADENPFAALQRSTAAAAV